MINRQMFMVGDKKRRKVGGRERSEKEQVNGDSSVSRSFVVTYPWFNYTDDKQHNVVLRLPAKLAFAPHTQA
ncbi:hypothetical protein [Aneurinibacillus migulanus]|uniref:hypothetical protein n=1 Tax=Aneurinibacillus migulanus TaxID=47500 RepID=UPI001F26A3C9|nr:hypothetical protein [Aneurinibacillus migulanus]